MDFKGLNKTLLQALDESAADKYLRITYDGKEVDVYTITRYIGNIIPEDYDNSKLKAEIVDAQNLREPEQVEEPKMEEDKILKEILDLGFIDTTGPKQKKNGILMLMGTKSGRGYKLEKLGSGYLGSHRAYVLNNYGQGTNGAYRFGKDSFEDSEINCLKWILDNAKEHLKRMENRKPANPDTDRRKWINNI